jgi:hypothetical protein
MLLLAFPIEIQSHILSFLPREDLATVVRASQHIHAVAIKFLYVEVELRSWEHIESFFLPGSLMPAGSISATEHADARRKHWDLIKDLTIYIPRIYGGPHPAFLPPRSLRGRGAQPLFIERLHLTYDLEPDPLIPLLRCLSPKRVHLSHTEPGSLGPVLSSFARDLLGWTRLSETTLELYRGFVPYYHHERFMIKESSPLRRVRSATIIFQGRWLWGTSEPSGRDAVEFGLQAFPVAQHLRIVADDAERQAKLEELLKGGYKGKPKHFFSVELQA